MHRQSGVSMYQSVIEILDLYIKLISIIPGIIVSLLILIFSNNKLEIIKDKSNNKNNYKSNKFFIFS